MSKNSQKFVVEFYNKNYSNVTLQKRILQKKTLEFCKRCLHKQYTNRRIPNSSKNCKFMLKHYMHNGVNKPKNITNFTPKLLSPQPTHSVSFLLPVARFPERRLRIYWPKDTH